MISQLSLEEVIAVKLEVAAKAIKNKKMFNLPIWWNLRYIIFDAVLKFACSTTSSFCEAAWVIGLSRVTLHKILRKYNISEYFEKELSQLDGRRSDQIQKV